MDDNGWHGCRNAGHTWGQKHTISQIKSNSLPGQILEFDPIIMKPSGSIWIKLSKVLKPQDKNTTNRLLADYWLSVDYWQNKWQEFWSQSEFYSAHPSVNLSILYRFICSWVGQQSHRSVQASLVQVTSSSSSDRIQICSQTPREIHLYAKLLQGAWASHPVPQGATNHPKEKIQFGCLFPRFCSISH